MNNISVIKKTKLIRVFQGNKSKVLCIDINHDNTQVATGSLNNQIKIWKLNSDSRPFRFSGHTGTVNVLKFDSTSKILISGGSDGQIIIWNNSTVGKNQKFKCHSALIRSLSFSLDNKKVISSSNDKTIKIWNLSKKNLKLSFFKSITCHNNWVLESNLSSDCFSICSIDTKNIKIYNLNQNKESFFYSEEESGLTCIKYNKSGGSIAVGNEKGKLRLWDIRTSKLTQSYDLKIGITSIDFHPNDILIGVGLNSLQGIIHFIDLIQGRTVLSIEKLEGPITSFCFSNDGSTFAFGCNKNLAQIWMINIENSIDNNNENNNEIEIIEKNESIEIKKNITEKEKERGLQENSKIYENFSLKLNDFVSSINLLTENISRIENKLNQNEERTNNLLKKFNVTNSTKKDEKLITNNFSNAEDKEKIELKIDDILNEVKNFDNNIEDTINNIENTELISFRISKIEKSECVFNDNLGESLKKPENGLNPNLTFKNSLNSDEYCYTKLEKNN